MKMKRIALIAFALIATVAGVRSASAETFSPPWGGSGGSQGFNYSCPSAGFLVGVSGRAGGYVDGVQAQCTGGGTQPYYGGTGGDLYSSTCPAGYVVRGATVQSGSYVDRVTLICGSLSAIRGGADPNNTNASSFGGTGGTTSFWFCPTGQAATGFYGAYGAWLDSLGLKCADVD